MPIPTSSPFFSNTAGTITPDPAGYAVLRYHAQHWKLPELAALYSQLTNLLLQHGWYRVLVDSRDLAFFPEEAKDWIRTSWLTGEATRLPRLLIATLLPSAVFSRLGISQMQLETVDVSHHRNFSDETSAQAFLLAQPTSSTAFEA